MLKSNNLVRDLIFFIFSFLLFALTNYFNPLIIYFLLNVLLVLYIISVLLKIWKKNKFNLLLNPLAIALVINYLFFSGGLTYFFLFDNYIPQSNVITELYINPVYYAKAGFLINLSSIFLVIGYNTKIGLRLNKFLLKISRGFSYREILPNSFVLSISVLIIYSIKLLLLENGLLGRLADISYTSESSSYILSQLNFFSKLSLLPLLFISFSYFKYKANRLLFYICIILELLFSFLEASRSPVISLFLLVFVVHFYVNRKISFRVIFFALIFFIATFTIITNFKNFANSNNFSSLSVKTIFDEFLGNKSTSTDFNIKDFYQTSFGRLNYVNEIAAGIQYKDQNGLSRSTLPFLEELFLIPIKTFIPALEQFKVLLFLLRSLP